MDIDELNKMLELEMYRKNNAPQEDFLGYSPVEIQAILDEFLGVRFYFMPLASLRSH